MSATGPGSERASIIRRHPYAVVLAGAVGFSLLNLLNDSPFLPVGEIEWHDTISQTFISAIMVGWIAITIRSSTTARTYTLFFLGCAKLVWLMTIKFFGELYADQTAILTTFELLLAVSGLLLITLGLVSWSREFRRNIEDLRISTSKFRELSEHDPLTGLLNRGQFDPTMSFFVERAHALSLVLIDLDHFKRINDEYGHPAGDVVIKRTSAILDAHLRDTDYAFRLGGEEFALLFVECPRELVAKRARMILETLADEQFSADDEREFSVTASLGVVHLVEDERPAELYRRADAALYQAKEHGRNRVVLA